MNIINFKGILQNEPLYKHTFFKIGGPAEYFFAPKNSTELKNFLKHNKTKEKITFIGQGSNLLVRDGGIDGIVIALKNTGDIRKINKNKIYADAMTSCAKLARFAVADKMYGAEFLSSIPGSLGGALAMNAGCFGSEIWQFVTKAFMVDKQGQTKWMERSCFNVSYRNVDFVDDLWFLGAEFVFDSVKGKSIKDLLLKRKESQPVAKNNCGSVFKNPKDDYAARLIDACGLKGAQIGGACISEKHANFIINKNNAKASDVEDLISLIKEQVFSRFKVKLELELKIIGKRC
jgi:UDP-N-acetylmuramate dehydrogenase